MFCSICSHSQNTEMIEHYVRSGSVRKTASFYGVGYRSFHRHLDLCVASILAEQEEQEFQLDFEEAAKLVRVYFQPEPEPYRRKTIITKQIAWTWSRRSWVSKTSNLSR